MRLMAGMLILAMSVEMGGCAAMFHGTSDQVTISSADPDAKIYMED